ncbi:hypothetical protein EDD21DRAFT_16510 [Dissophora ornata]|nr:hypothetical protein EDD21DRAFT_16510 [Dissophora ornata]
MKHIEEVAIVKIEGRKLMRVCVLVAALAILEFRKQNGTLSANIKNLSPSPDVRRFYKSARVVKHCIMLCLCLNTILCLSCVVSLALYGFHFSVVYQTPSLTSTIDGNGLSVPAIGPLFRLAQQDRDAYHPAIAFILVLVSFFFLLWGHLRGLKKTILCYLRSEEFEEQANTEDISVFPFPFNYMQSSEFLATNRGNGAKTGRDSNASGGDQKLLERIGGEQCLKMGFALNDHTMRMSHWDIETGLHSSPLAEYSPGSNQCWSKTSPAIDSGSSVHVTDGEFYKLSDYHFEGAGVGSKLDESRDAAPVRVQQFPVALTAYRERYSSSWLPSAPVHGHSLSRSSHGGKMMGQYLQLSRQTPSVSKSCLDISPQSASMLPESGLPFVYTPTSRQAATNYIGRTSEMKRSNTPRPQTFASPKSAPEMSGSILPTRGRAITARPEIESPESDSLILNQKSGPYMMTPQASYSGRGSNSAPYSSYRRPVSSSGLQRLKSDSQSGTDSLAEQGVDGTGWLDRARLSAVQMERYGDRHPSDTHSIAHNGDQDDGHIHISEGAIGYDRILKKLAKIRRRASATKTKNTVLFPSTSQADSDSNADDNGGDERCEVETMGAISLEELVGDNRISKHDSIHHTMMPENGRKMLETLVLQALQSFDTPVEADLVSLRRGHIRRSTGGRGRRQLSTVQRSAPGPYPSYSDQQRGRSRDRRSATSHLQIISIDNGRPRPDSDFFGEDEATSNWRVSTSPDRDESTSREISTVAAQEAQDLRERFDYNAEVPPGLRPKNFHSYGRHVFDFHRGYSGPVKTVSCLSESTDTSARRYSSSHLPTGPEASLAPIEVGEPKIYSARLDRMIALPKGVPPTKTQSSRLQKAPSVRQLHASMEDRAILEQLLAMGPLPPAPSAVPPPTPPASPETKHRHVLL